MSTHHDEAQAHRRALVALACELFRRLWGRDGGATVKSELARYIAWGWEPQDAALQVAADLQSEGLAYA